MIWRFLLSIMFALAIICGAVAFDYQRFLDTPLQVPGGRALLDVPRGASLDTVARTLTKRGMIDHPYYFIAMTYLGGQQTQLKAGEYTLTPELKPRQLLELLVSGAVNQYRITLIEGWTFRRALAAIDAHPEFGGQGLATLSDDELMTRLGAPEDHPEGRLYPDTYIFPRSATGMDVLQRAFKRMNRILDEEWQGRSDGLPFGSAYEALILASIIEKETGVAAERPQVAGVFVRRLNKGMRLQTDPTVIYGMGERYQGDITRTDLRESTPYNTYVIDGLPPTPIALPGRPSIHAAVHPADGDALYFVATGNGGHQFSATYEEHQRAVQRYILGNRD